MIAKYQDIPFIVVMSCTTTFLKNILQNKAQVFY